MHELHGGYISSALWDHVLCGHLSDLLEFRAALKAHSHFLVSSVLRPELSPDPIAVLLANLLRRGLPTLPSLYLEQELVSRTGLVQLELTGRSQDTQRWVSSLTQSLEILKPLLEQAICPVECDFHPGPAPDFAVPGFDSAGEEQFYMNQLRRSLGHAWALVERQRPVATITNDPRFIEQRADFCLEFHGVAADQARGAVIEFDGEQHQLNKQRQLDLERDASCRKAGWVVIRVPAQDADNFPRHPDLLKLQSHPRYHQLSEHAAHPLAQSELGRRVKDLIWLPMGVARLQAVLAEALLSGRLSLSAVNWRICVVERDLSCAEIAVADLTCWIQALLNLYLPSRQAPHVDLQVVNPNDLSTIEQAQHSGNEQPFDLLLDQAVFGSCGSHAIELQHIATDCRLVIRSGYRPLDRRRLATTDRRLPLPPEQPGPALQFFLQNLFRKGSYREKQLEILERALRRQSTIALLPTGAGKSLTYQLSALLTNGVVLIIDPIKSLMKDQVDNLVQVGIDYTGFINSSMRGKERKEAGKDMAEGRVKFTFISPERLLIDDFRTMLQAMHKVRFCFAVVDEAHCVSEWGHDFRTAYLRLGENLRRFCLAETEKIPILALTGTASHEVLGDVQRELQLTDGTEEIIKPEKMARDELHFRIISLDPFPTTPTNAKQQKISEIVGKARQDLLPIVLDEIARDCIIDSKKGRTFPELVNPEHQDHGSGLVFCPHVNWVHGVKAIHDVLVKHYPSLEDRVGVYAGSLTDELGGAHLIRTQDDFKQGRVTVLACTKAFGMGIDKDNIRFTVHMNLPQSLEAFYQEAGRAGRDRQPAHCCILYAGSPKGSGTSVDLGLMESFHINSFRGQEQEVIKIFDLLDRVRMPGERGLDQICGRLNAESGMPVRCNLFPKTDPKFIYVNDLFSGEKLARLRLPRLEVQEADLHNEDAIEAINALVQSIRTECPNEKDLTEWLKQRKAPVDGPGLEELLTQIPVGETRLIDIPFDNGITEDLADFLLKGQAGWTKEVVEAAYGYTTSEEEFLARLDIEYWKSTQDTANIREVAVAAAKKAFAIVRNEAQTFRTIYRLSTLGVVDDYTIDYAAKIITIRLQKLPDGEITRTLQCYIGRYEDLAKTEAIPSEVEALTDTTEFRRALRRLVRFVYEKIAAKRRKALETMDQTTRAGINDSSVFSREVYSYFDSKYTESLRGFVKDYAFCTPLLVMAQVGTAPHDISHLLGSCKRLLEENSENAALLILSAVSMAFIRAYDEMDVQRLLRAGLEQYRSRAGWNRRIELQLLQSLVDRVGMSDPLRTAPFENEILLNHMTWLKNYTENIEGVVINA